MKIGIFLATQWPEGAPLGAEIENLCAQVRACRDAGFASVWVGQHFLTGPSLQMVQTGPLLARLAAEGDGMTFGPAILLLAMQNPVIVAEDAASLDWITGGNFILGLGMGYREEEFEALGAPFAERVGRFREGIELIRRLWREDRVDHQGRYFRVDNLGASIRPKQPGGPPIWLAGEVEAAVRRAATLGDAWMAPPTVTFDAVENLLKGYREARSAAGLPPAEAQPLIRECAVGATAEAAMATARGPLLYKYESYASWGQADSAGTSLADEFDSFVTDRFVIGDEAQVADELARYRDALGVDHMILRLQWPGLEQAAAIDAIERVGRVAVKLG